MLDWEVAGGGHDPEDAAAFLDEAESLFQTQLFVYTGPGFADRWPALRETALGTRPIIVAHYGVRKPTIPHAWKAAAGWQYAGDDGCSVPGIQSPRVDHDVYFGTLDGLRAQLRAMAAPWLPVPEVPRAESVTAPVQLDAIGGVA